MPKRTDISSILVIGAGPVVIGQACEGLMQRVLSIPLEAYRSKHKAPVLTETDGLEPGSMK